jgi:hypothetical protein
MVHRKRFMYFLSLLAIVAATSWMASRISATLLKILLPTLTTFLAVFSFRISYPWIRFKVHDWWRVATAPQSPYNDPSAPVDFPEAKDLYTQELEHHHQAVQVQGSYVQDGTTAALMAPTALLMLSIQLLAFPAGGSWAAGFALADASCLAMLIFFGLRSERPSEAWIVNRLKAELFRRELGLRVLALGPYLGMTKPQAEGESLKRSARIRAAGTVEELLLSLPLSESGTPWLAHIFDPSRHAEVPSDYLDRMRAYAQHRVRSQLAWFNRQRHLERRKDQFCLLPLIISAILATIVASADFLRILMQSRSDNTGAFAIAGLTLGMFNIGLPPLILAIQAIRTLHNWRARGALFKRKEQFLTKADARATGLIRRWDSPETVDSQAERRSFEVFALWTEQALTEEMEQWVLLVDRPRFDV